VAGARAEAGRELRKVVPRSSHAVWDPAGRPSPLRPLEETNRHRGARAGPDPGRPHAGLAVRVPAGRAGGDGPRPVHHPGHRDHRAGLRRRPPAQLRAVRHPERNLSFGLNDFDETLPAPWEWDVKRLAISFVVAGRTVGFDPAVCRRAALAVVGVYREQVARYAGMRLLEVWYSRVDAAEIVAMARGRRRREVARRLDRAEHHTNLDALPRLTEPVGGDRRFVEDPPLLTHVDDIDERWVTEVLASYRSSLSDERRQLLLQVKQSTSSVLEPYAGRGRYRHPRHRVVNGQRLLQTASDIFLSWAGDGASRYYIRQLWDMKGSINLETLDPADFVP
jgi:hypothetical protein